MFPQIKLSEMPAACTLGLGPLGSQPMGFTCLHLACDGSDKQMQRKSQVRSLLYRRVNLEERTATGNTPLLLACGSGIVDVQEELVNWGADVHAKNNRGLGVYQSGRQASHTSARRLAILGVPRPQTLAPSQRQWHAPSVARQTRAALRGWP